LSWATLRRCSRGYPLHPPEAGSQRPDHGNADNGPLACGGRVVTAGTGPGCLYCLDLLDQQQIRRAAMTAGTVRDQGLVEVEVGSRVQLDIPADLAYGDHPGGGQPAAALRFVVDVLSPS
jgi:hypothetical protein